MNKEIHKLEQELLAIKPREISQRTRSEILSKINADKQESHKLIPFYRPFLNLSGVAAIIVLMFVFQTKFRSPGSHDAGTKSEQVATSPSPSASRAIAYDNYRPVRLDSVIINMKDQGIIDDGDSMPVRKIRYDYMDHVRWTNQHSGRSFETVRPRKEVILVGLPVN